MVDIQSATAEIRRGKEEEIKNIMVYHIPQGFQKKQDENIMLRRAAIKYTTANYGIYHTAFFLSIHHSQHVQPLYAVCLLND